MVLPSGACLYFLVQMPYRAGYHGNLYLDEVFLDTEIPGAAQGGLRMALHKNGVRPIFPTPSSLTHSAYPFWSGALFNKGRPKIRQGRI